MHQISRRSQLRLRARRVSFGQSLYLLVRPTGRRYWHYRYSFEGREKLISLGCYPDVPIESAWARRHAARHFLEAGVDPAREKRCGEYSSILSDQIGSTSPVSLPSARFDPPET